MGWPSSQVEVETWLKTVANIDSAEVLSTFRDNEIDGEVLFDLTKEDIKELGIKKLGPVKKLVSAIAKGSLATAPGSENTVEAKPAQPQPKAEKQPASTAQKPAAKAAPTATKKKQTPAKTATATKKKQTPAKTATAKKQAAKKKTPVASQKKQQQQQKSAKKSEKRKQPETPAAPSAPPVKKAKTSPAPATPGSVTLNRKQKRAVARLVRDGQSESEALAQVLADTAADKAQKSAQKPKQQPQKTPTQEQQKPVAKSVQKKPQQQAAASPKKATPVPESKLEPEQQAEVTIEAETEDVEMSEASTPQQSGGESDQADDASSSDSEEDDSSDNEDEEEEAKEVSAPVASPKSSSGYPKVFELPDFLKEEIQVTSISPGRLLFLCQKSLKNNGPSSKQTLEAWLWQHNGEAMKHVEKRNVSKTLDRALQKGVKQKKLFRQGSNFMINERYNPNHGR